MLALVGIGLVAHGLNMFHYPSFTLRDDEGIYAAQAWAVLRLGQLSPYTYFYDHAPGGWLLLAAWMAWGILSARRYSSRRAREMAA